MVELLDSYTETLPERPYCTDDFTHGLRILPKDAAIQKKYIQSNDPANLRWLTYDLDSPTAYFDWDDKGGPAPNILVWNKQNGHAHYFYALENPVYTQDACKNHKSYRYMAAVDCALTDKLDADPAYGKLIQKNPLSEYWHVETLQKSAYTLDWLTDYLDLSKFTDRRKNLPAVGLGRNCTLFDRTRKWAYRSVRQEWLNFDGFHYAVYLVAAKYNDFPTPLPEAEIRSISKSVSRWTWKNFDRDGFLLWSKNRRKKSLEIRQERARQNARLVFNYLSKNPQATQTEIAEAIGINQSTVSRLLSTDITNAYSIHKNTLELSTGEKAYTENCTSEHTRVES